MQTTLSITACVVCMLLTATAGASFGVAIAAEYQDLLLDHSDQLWDNPMFMRIAEMVGLI